MNIFTWLLVGHLVGDWMFQNDWMARGKQRRFFNKEIFVHCCAYTVVVALSLWLGSQHHTVSPPYLTIVLLIFLSHWFIDAGQLADRWTRLWRQSRLDMVRMMVDQTMHIIVLAAVAEWIG
ncbi:MAG: DUF3307 domain-containing protein [Caldilineaceae bacterium]|nr:DUF3307 domain-containing protein [Caldilineaceae bacterium]